MSSVDSVERFLAHCHVDELSALGQRVIAANPHGIQLGDAVNFSSDDDELACMNLLRFSRGEANPWTLVNMRAAKRYWRGDLNGAAADPDLPLEFAGRHVIIEAPPAPQQGEKRMLFELKAHAGGGNMRERFESPADACNWAEARGTHAVVGQVIGALADGTGGIVTPIGGEEIIEWIRQELGLEKPVVAEEKQEAPQDTTNRPGAGPAPAKAPDEEQAGNGKPTAAPSATAAASAATTGEAVQGAVQG